MVAAKELPAIRKEDMFHDALNDEEQEILRDRVAKQQKITQEFERRHLMKRATKILRVHPYLTLDEIRETLLECRDDEVSFLFKVPIFISRARKKLVFFLPITSIYRTSGRK